MYPTNEETRESQDSKAAHPIPSAPKVHVSHEVGRGLGEADEEGNGRIKCQQCS